MGHIVQPRVIIRIKKTCSKLELYPRAYPLSYFNSTPLIKIIDPLASLFRIYVRSSTLNNLITRRSRANEFDETRGNSYKGINADRELAFN